MLKKTSRYIIGIDLGTTNSALSYVDTQSDSSDTHMLGIPQIIAPGEIAIREILPSYLYLPDPATISPGTLNLPWETESIDSTAGIYARKMGTTSPGRVISSAKSWLCCENIDRSSQNLPMGSDDKPKLSAIEAMTAYLKHIAGAWDYSMAGTSNEYVMKNQDVILTVPASFDAVARELTVRAAEMAGISVTLLEEPQAAFYCFLHENEDSWRDQVKAGWVILVCDIGGGTTDFSLIGVEDQGGDLKLNRIAVGNHILLGGDNMDITLAYAIQKKLGVKLNTKQMAGLIHSCREAKEKICSNPNIQSEKITILGSGSSLIGGTLSSELTKEEVTEYLINGFLPVCDLSAVPVKNTRAGLRSFGLNYEADTALTRHLASFIQTYSPKDENGKTINPHALLFNGGVTKAYMIKERLFNTIAGWSEGQTHTLTGTDPDLAVARGAAWFGFVRRGNGIRIKSGSPFSYYLGIESSMPAVPGFTPPVDALCVISSGTENGTERDIPIEHLGLIVGEHTEFKFFSSNSREEIGTLIPDNEADRLNELPSLTAFLSDEIATPGSMIPVTLKAVFTEIGTVQIWCYEKRGSRKWRLEFNLEP